MWVLGSFWHQCRADYYTLTIRDHGFNANIGEAANLDDLSLQAIIPWGQKDAA